jgi:hypothetical protein
MCLKEALTALFFNMMCRLVVGAFAVLPEERLDKSSMFTFTFYLAFMIRRKKWVSALEIEVFQRECKAL